MNSKCIYAVVKRGKFFKGSDYCTGFKPKASWTEDPRAAHVMWHEAAKSYAKQFGGKVEILKHLQPAVGTVLYRLENDLLYDGEGGMKIRLKRFEVVRRTPRGAWVRRMHITATGKWVAPAYEKDRFILDGKGKRHAYADMRDALASFRARKQSQVEWLESRLLQAKAALEILDRPDFETDKTFYLESLRKYREY